MADLRHERNAPAENDQASVAVLLYEDPVPASARSAAVPSETAEAVFLPDLMLFDAEDPEAPIVPMSQRDALDLVGATGPSPEITNAELVERLGARSFREREQAMQALMQRGVASFDALADGLCSEHAEIRSRSRRVLETVAGKATVPGVNEKQGVHRGEIPAEHIEQDLHKLLGETPAARQVRVAILEKYLEIAKKHSALSQFGERVSESLGDLGGIDQYTSTVYLALAGSNRWPIWHDMSGLPVPAEKVDASKKAGVDYLVKAMALNPEIYKTTAFAKTAPVFDAAGDPKFQAAIKLAHEKTGEPITDAEISRIYSENAAVRQFGILVRTK
ncbi:MAG: hypothetical protein K2W95_11575 [Candidatus Obscuribacterales bacterium]|nr:hypothetical protein [Candidatus Obscuribacterales bacterium]